MLKIYNTLTGKKEIFASIKPNQASVYICGVTVYDYCHLGHARTYSSADVMVRYLRFCGYEVTYVRNITDIDDKIIKRANENAEDFHAVTARFTEAMHEDFSALNLCRPNIEPKATEFVPHMVSLIQTMIEQEHAYVASNGDVYFSVRSVPDYGCLSHHDIEQLESGARVEVAEAKHDPLDFVLWKIAKPNEPAWESPWGKGRPGWHTECVAMSMDLLGKKFDIHGGGRDLIFPHHENEIAQAHAVSSQFANIWVHGGFLQIEKEKMSKSLGNFVTIRDLLREHEAEVLRYFLIASHYRSPLVYTAQVLQQSKQSLMRLYTALRFLPAAERAINTSFEQDFIAAMDDDFNTPVALSVLFELAHEIERQRDKNKNQAASFAVLLRYLGNVLGILQHDPEAFFQPKGEVDTDKINMLISARQIARQNKEWTEADRLRQELTEMGISIEDTANGTTWKRL